MSSELPPVVDLCAASGLFARAFKDEGFPVVQGFELDPRRAAAWSANLGAPCAVADVLKLTPAELAVHKDARGRLVVIGGVPCQDFSTMNRFREEDTSLRDHVLELVAAVEPVACAIENVRNAWKGVRDVVFVRDADVGGFTIRERGFYGAPAPELMHAERPSRRLDGRTVPAWRGWGDAIAGFDFMADFTQQDDWENRGSLQIRHRTVPAWTVTTKNDLVMWRKAGRRALRWLETEDLAALQGFPRDWTFPAGGKRAARGCIGDAVPYAMGRAIARAVRLELTASR